MRTLPLLAGLLFLAPGAQAGPYVTVKTNAKGVDRDYSSLKKAARVGVDWKLGALTPYIEVGGGLVHVNRGHDYEYLAIETGSRLEITEHLDTKLEIEAFRFPDSVSWEVEVEAKYHF